MRVSLDCKSSAILIRKWLILPLLLMLSFSCVKNLKEPKPFRPVDWNALKIPILQIPCIAATPKDHIRGLIVHHGKEGPEVRLALMRQINQTILGRLRFDLKAIQRLKTKLEKTSLHSEYVISVNNTKYAVSPNVRLIGTFRLVKFFGKKINYEDLIDFPWQCSIPSTLSDLYSTILYRELARLGHSTRPNLFLFHMSKCELNNSRTLAISLNLHALNLAIGRFKFRYNSFQGTEAYSIPWNNPYRAAIEASFSLQRKGELIAFDYADYTKDFSIENREKLLELIEQDRRIIRDEIRYLSDIAGALRLIFQAIEDGYMKAWRDCVPSGDVKTMLSIWEDGESPNSIRIHIFSNSVNPLYPSSRYFHLWSHGQKSIEKLKTHSQIHFLASKQKSLIPR